MQQPDLPAYCFFRQFDPEPAKEICFDRHYLLYSAHGVMNLRDGQKSWTLPPARAAWIPANKPIVIDIPGTITCCSLLFDPGVYDSPVDHCRVLTLPKLLQDMILYARRWGPGSKEFSAHAENHFNTILHMCAELHHQPGDTWIPRSDNRNLQTAIDLTWHYMGDSITFSRIASEAAISERSLARIFADETGMTWRQLLRRMRMIRAMELLGNTDQSIAGIALDCGYQSQSSFNAAFTEYSHMTPTAFRQLGHEDLI